MKIFGIEIKRFNRSSNPAINDRKLLGPGKTTSTNDYISKLSNTFLSRRYKEHHSIDLTQYANTASADQLINILIDSNPDVSQALYSFLRMCNSGYVIKVFDNEGKPFVEGQKIIDRWVKTCDLQQTNKGFKEDRSLNSFVNKIHLSFFTKGASACEVVLNKKIEPSYLQPVDPNSIWFRRSKDEEELVPWQLQDGEEKNKGKWEGNYKKINIPSFFYQPLDARLDDVYGISPILPVLQVVFFQIQVYQDLQAVVHKAGFPRIEITLMEEILIKNAPPQIKHNAKALTEWLNARKADIETQYKDINPDDAAIHFDSVKLQFMGGSQQGLSSYDARALIEVIDAQVIAALKSLSTLMGRYRGRTETYASAEVQLYIKGVEAIQKVSGLVMGRMLTFCLNMFGQQGYVEFQYLPIELRSKTELAQWNAIRIKNELTFLALGFESFDEVCIELTGHKPRGTQRNEIELILALLGVKYPTFERPSTPKEKEEESFRTVEELLAKINGAKK